MAIITSAMIGVDTAANKPAAAVAGRLYYETDTNRVWYDNGSAWVPWKYTDSLTMLNSPTATSYVLTGAYASAGGMHFLRNFSGFRQGRLTAWTSFLTGFTGPNAYAKVVDTTNSKDLSDIITVTSNTAARYTSAWKNLDSATYAGDAEFELQAFGDNPGDTLKLFFVQLELR